MSFIETEASVRYELINGKSEKVITYCSHLNTQNLINNYSNLKVGFKPTQQ